MVSQGNRLRRSTSAITCPQMAGFMSKTMPHSMIVKWAIFAPISCVHSGTQPKAMLDSGLKSY